MQDRKLSLMIATSPYGGNGQAMAEHPNVRDWLIQTDRKLAQEPRIEKWTLETYNDTPITMVRNRAVMDAREAGADLLLFVDSDQSPDCMIGVESEATPFWDAAFSFVYKKWDKGPHVVGAPYCGGGTVENVFVFQWRRSVSSFDSEVDMKLSQYTREEAVRMSGIQECAALPTGLILYDMRAFDLIEPKTDDRESLAMARLNSCIERGHSVFTANEVRQVVRDAISESDRIEQPFFYYEYPTKYQTEKASTEDVTNTRDISLAGLTVLGYNPMYCAWSSWAGHWKPRNVTKPRLLTPKDVSVKLGRAMTRSADPRHSACIDTDAGDDAAWASAPRAELEKSDEQPRQEAEGSAPSARA